MVDVDNVDRRRRIAGEVYRVTGVHIPEDDVLVLAALFYSEKLQEAAREAAGHITVATATGRAVVDDAADVVRKAAANNSVLADAIEARLQKGLRQILKSHSTQAGGTVLTARHMLASFAAGAAAVVLATFFAAGFSYSWIGDAADGRAFNRIFSQLGPAAKAKIIEQLKKDMKS
jgi:hypothetical protein